MKLESKSLLWIYQELNDFDFLFYLNKTTKQYNIEIVKLRKELSYVSLKVNNKNLAFDLENLYFIRLYSNLIRVIIRAFESNDWLDKSDHNFLMTQFITTHYSETYSESGRTGEVSKSTMCVLIRNLANLFRKIGLSREGVVKNIAIIFYGWFEIVEIRELFGGFLKEITGCNFDLSSILRTENAEEQKETLKRIVATLKFIK